METRELFRLALMHSSGAIPDESRQSLPIPVRQGMQLRASFLFVPSVARPGSVELFTPDYIATLAVSDGRLIVLQSLQDTPGQADSGDRHHSIGTFKLPDGVTVEEYLEWQGELFSAYDALLPFFERNETGIGKNGREWALRFRELFDLVSEPPLRPFYESFGSDFFEWVARLASE